MMNVNNYVVTLCFRSTTKDEGRSCPRSLVFYYIDFGILDCAKVHKVNKFKCDIPSPKPNRVVSELLFANQKFVSLRITGA
jgi:hypothetical protein